MARKRTRKRLAFICFSAGVLSALFLTALIMLAVLLGKNKTVSKNETACGLNTQKIQTSNPTPLASEYPKAEGSLKLVNWNNPTDDKRPDELVLLSHVLGGAAMIQNEEASINKEAGEALHAFCTEALSDGIEMYYITSAYRSVSYQWTLWNRRIEQEPNYGSDPYENPVKVMPGNMSEHSTGLAIDILSINHKNADDAYGETAAGMYLAQNAHKYGFIIRYPKNKEHITGVIYEPWHLRYVGKEHAKAIYEQNVCLEEYLGKDIKKNFLNE